MKEMDLDLPLYPDFGDLPVDLDQFLKADVDQILKTLLENEGGLFDDVVDDFTDVTMTTALSSPDRTPLRQNDMETPKTCDRKKRRRGLRSERCTDKNKPSRAKRRRRADIDAGSEQNPSPAETSGVSTPPPRILDLHPPVHPSVHLSIQPSIQPSIQFITLPDSPGYPIVQRLSPHQVIILVHTSSPPCRHQIPPLSPADAAVAPVHTGSSPPGSRSDSASKALSPPSTSPSPPSPNDEMSPGKNSPPPQSPPIPDLPQNVKDFIQETKAHLSQHCQEMAAGMSLSSHYVDVQLVQREILRSGKNTNKSLDKELVNMGDTDRKTNSVGRSQIFESSSGNKPKRYILLLGNAGMGKTTLIRKLCLDWSRDLLSQFDFVFLLDGKSLRLTAPTFSLQTLLLSHSSFASPCKDPAAVFGQILAAPQRVLIIFDGFEELRDYELLLQTQEKDLTALLLKDRKAETYTVRQLYAAVLQRILLPGCSLLISTRPRGTASQLLRRADSLLEVHGFTPEDVETYLSQYFTNPTLFPSTVERLKSCGFLLRLCWNPGLCRLVCSVVEGSKNSDPLPRTLTGLCHQALHLKIESERRRGQTETLMQSGEESPAQVKWCKKRTRTQTNTHFHSQRHRTATGQKTKEEGEEGKGGGGEEYTAEERELLSKLGSLAWEGVKGHSSVLPAGRSISAKVKEFGLRTGIFSAHRLRMRRNVSAADKGGEGREDVKEEEGEKTEERKRKTERMEVKNDSDDEDVLLWADTFLHSFLAGLHLSLSRTVSARTFLQTLPLQAGVKARRRPQREEQDLTYRFAVGLLFQNRAKPQRGHANAYSFSTCTPPSKQALVTKHLEDLSHSELSPAHILEACHCVYEAGIMHGVSGDELLANHLAMNIPQVLPFRGIPLSPPDVFAVQNVLERGGAEGRRFCLDLENSGIQICGLKALVGLRNISSYRACIADVIALWEELEQSGEEDLLKGAVSKFKIHPLKATQVCHIQHLAKLVNIHTHRRLSDSSSQLDSILAEGVPAVKELHKLEFELGPENGPLALPTLWELLPGLQNLQHLDLENSKMGDRGAESLAVALVLLRSLEILNLSQNCIGDRGVKKLVVALRTLPCLHCLSLYSNVVSDEGAESLAAVPCVSSLYSNVVSDEGAESLAAVLPHMASLTDLDVKYNKLTDAGAQSLGVSLRKCPQMKSLR
ncbi:hypothetical protein LDENG_00266610 [Lucifuga dentata]|nr:hypothetical protein LDENG_00266610 [Lucifuga dentata]